MKYIILFVCCLPGLAAAQSKNDHRDIMKPINTLFMGMNLGDSAMVRSVFALDASMASIGVDKNGTPLIRKESSIAGFLKAVGTPHNEPWSEPIWDTKIEVDGDFAQVWTSYAFYVGNVFSHCGVDAFQLIKREGEWKIFYLADTRRKEDCDIPPSIHNKFK
jgi:hypothetical protein